MRLAAGRPGERDCGHDRSLSQGSASRDEGSELESSDTRDTESTGLSAGGNRRSWSNSRLTF